MFKYFRVIFGIYLFWHFSNLIPYAEELFGNDMPFDPKLSPVYGLFPNILNYVNATYFIIFLTIVSIVYADGHYYKICGLILWYGWAALLNRNIFIANPGIPYVGWLLLASTLVSNKKNSKITNKIFWFAWFLMALGYTCSGLHKFFLSPSWIDGTALLHVLENPLARDNIIRDMVLALPPIFLKLATWFSLILEISFLPFGTLYHTRFYFWLIYFMFHLGIMMVINFTDLTLGVLMIHIFTFDPRWIPMVTNVFNI